jgi:two-component system NtrC family response regulator
VLLANAFVQRFCAESRRGSLTLTDDAVAAIERYGWPGNVRELENAIKRAVVMAEGARITADDLGMEAADADDARLNLRQVRDEAERGAVIRVLARTNGNIARAADILGVSRPTLYDLMNRFGLKREA